jgi:hypothetical protein
MESTSNMSAQPSAKTDEEKIRYDRRARLKELNLNTRNQGPYDTHTFYTLHCHIMPQNHRNWTHR